jgi:hypothetical protein
MVNIYQMLSGRVASCSLFCIVASLALASNSGCGRSGPEIATVSGTVTLDNQPLQGAIILFTPDLGRASRGRSGADGTYELRYSGNEAGALVGQHKVSISTRSIDEDVKTGKMTQIPEKLPAKYHEKSELTETVGPGSNTIDFVLTSK